MAPNKQLTVYSLRLTTAYCRGAALSDPYSGVNILLVGKNGRAYLHRIIPVNDPSEAQSHLEGICEASGKGPELVGEGMRARRPRQGRRCATRVVGSFHTCMLRLV